MRTRSAQVVLSLRRLPSGHRAERATSPPRSEMAEVDHVRLLLVEDEQRLARLIGQGLTEAGFVVDLAHDGVTGESLATDPSYDVLVLDLMLPGRTGDAVLHNLRSAGVWTPALVLTAKDGVDDLTTAFALGADDYLTKPFSFAELVARLRALVRRGATERPVPLTVGDLTLDPEHRTVRRGGTEVALTAKELALLTHLMRHPGRVVSTRQILDAVWDPAFDGTEAIVDVYVEYLRHKVDTPFGVRTLETVPGAGYRIVAPGTRTPPG